MFHVLDMIIQCDDKLREKEKTVTEKKLVIKKEPNIEKEPIIKKEPVIDTKTAEQVIDRRIRNCQIEYYIKWKGHSSDYNTWENEINLDVPDLILQFERNNSNAAFKYYSGEHSENADEEKKPVAFDRGLQPKQILGIFID